MTQDYDLIIVGAGLVGATLAARVASGEQGSNLRIALIEAGGEPESFSGQEFDPRVVALTPASEQLLRELEVWESVAAERVCLYSDMEVWDGEGNGAISFSAADCQADHLGHIVENSLLVRSLRRRLEDLPQVELIQPASVTDLHLAEKAEDPVEVTLDNGNHCRATLVIAADGANSQLRALGGFDTREWAYDQRAIITTVRTETPHAYTARQRFMHTGPLAFLPLRWQSNEGWAAHYCSIVWSADNALADELMGLDEQAFCERLGRDFEYRLGAVTGCAERFAIPLKQRHAREYIKPGLALVGDAAHSIHPLAGQGVNLGLSDVAVLAEELERALARGLATGDYSILRRYQRRRLGENLGMMSVMETFKRLFGNSSPELTWLRNTGMGAMNKLGPIKNAIVRRAMGL